MNVFNEFLIVQNNYLNQKKERKQLVSNKKIRKKLNFD